MNLRRKLVTIVMEGKVCFPIIVQIELEDRVDC